MRLQRLRRTGLHEKTGGKGWVTSCYQTYGASRRKTLCGIGARRSARQAVALPPWTPALEPWTALRALRRMAAECCARWVLISMIKDLAGAGDAVNLAAHRWLLLSFIGAQPLITSSDGSIRYTACSCKAGGKGGHLQ